MSGMLALPRRGVVIRQRRLHVAGGSLEDSGLEGQVRALHNSPLLFKSYFEPLDAEAAARLQRLIDLADDVGAGDRALIGDLFTWPAHRVLDEYDRTVGVLLPAAEPRFYFEHAGQQRLREGQFLPRSSSVAEVVDVPARLRLLRDLAIAWDFLARHGLVYGDANSRNLVYAVSGATRVLLLDVDGMHRDGETAAARFQPKWSDPYSSMNTTQSDRYLLALWILRVLTFSMITVPRGQVPSDWDDCPAPLANDRDLQFLLRRGLGYPGARPAPSDYFTVLDRLVKITTPPANSSIAVSGTALTPSCNGPAPKRWWQRKHAGRHP